MQSHADGSGASIAGEWRLHATTFRFMADPRKHDVRLRYTVLRDEPLRLRNETLWRNDEGHDRSLVGIDRLGLSGDHHWRGSGLMFFVTTQWGYNLSADGSVAVLYYSATLLSPAGHHVLARAGVPADRVASILRDESIALGIPRQQQDLLLWRKD